MPFADYVARIIGTTLQESLADLIRVESMEDQNTLVFKDGTMVSLIMMRGGFGMPDEQGLEDMVEEIRLTLSSYMSAPGHCLEFNFTRDADSARRELETIVSKSGRQARSLGLDIEDILEERMRNLSRYMVAETCIIAVYTRPDVLSPDELKIESQVLLDKLKKQPIAGSAHSICKTLDSAHIRHLSFTENVRSVMRSCGQMADVMSVTAALQEIRAGLYPSTAPEKFSWEPRLPKWGLNLTNEDGIKKPQPPVVAVSMPETDAQMRAQDFSPLFEPSFDMQLATEEGYVETHKVVRVGDSIFQAFDMTLAPESLPSFNNLVRDITAKSKSIPWRASMRIEAGGLHSQGLKNLFLSIFTFANPTHNGRIKDAIQALRDMDGQSDSIVKFKMSFATWAPMNKHDQLRKNAQTVIGAVQRWGSARADGISGDPFATLISTVPGVTLSSTAPVSAAPLRDVLAMAPIARQASPWDSGSLIYRTDDGKIWPFQPGSSKQTTWVTLFCGTPGSGKSVMMNAINFASAITPSTAGGNKPLLSRIAMIDIGSTSSGLISLIQEALPPERRHEVVFRKLRMRREDAINVFDTQLGMREPTSLHRQFLSNFIALICSDGERSVSMALKGLITASIERAYLDARDDRQPRRYQPQDEPMVDQALTALGIPLSSEMIWWEVVDAMMAAGKIHEAEVAQRHAVPTLADVVTASQADQVASLYADVHEGDTGQPVLAAFQRTISEVTRDYPLLASHTQFSVGGARIISLDLMEVAPNPNTPAARKQSAMMYMLARQILTRDFFLHEDEFRLAHQGQTMPAIYLDYHINRARENLQMPKIFAMDEFHRTGSMSMIVDQLLTDCREGRKHNIDIKVASQLIDDFPQSLVEVASTIFVCNAGAESSIDKMDALLHLTDGERMTIRRELSGPQANYGAPVWAFFRMRNDRNVRQKLVLTLGPAEIWAFSTTAEDVVLRKRLYDELGPRLTRKVLARRFPGGTAKGEIESRVARLADLGERYNDDQVEDIIGMLVEDLKSQALLLQND